MVEVSHLSKNYGSHPAIRDLTFSVADGQVYGLLGPNGAGKSTIMNILTSYLAPTGGEVKVAGFSLPEQAQQAKACVGYLPEQPPLYPEMTVPGSSAACPRATASAWALRRLFWAARS